MFFIVVDAHSKWPEIIKKSTTTAAKTITVLRHIFAKYGISEQLVSDNGQLFIADEFDQFMRGNGIRHVRSASCHPASNGLAERFVRTFKEAIKAAKQDSFSLPQRLENFLLTYRTTPHATTSESSCALFLGRILRTRWDLLRPSLEQRVCDKQATQKQLHDKWSKSREFFVGQHVMAKNLRPGPAWIPGVIIQRLGPLSYLVEVEGDVKWKRHVDQVKERSDTPTSSDDSSEDELVADFPVNPGTGNLQLAQPATTTTPLGTHNPTESLEPHYPRRDHRPPDRFKTCQTLMCNLPYWIILLGGEECRVVTCNYTANG